MIDKRSLTPLGEVMIERQEMPSLKDIASGRIRVIEKISFDTGRIQLRSNGSTRTGMILVRPGDLVVSGINAAKGAIAIYDPQADEAIAATIHYGAYIPNPERADSRFLWWMLRSRSFRDLVAEYVPGGIKTELKAKRLLPVPVPIPPLSAQRRIVSHIEELAAKIEEAQRLRREAIEEGESILSSCIGTTLDRFYREGITMPVDSLCVRIVDCKHYTPRYCSTGGHPAVRTGDIHVGWIDSKSAKRVELEDYENMTRQYKPTRNDVLYAREGNWGNAGIIETGESIAISQRVMLFSPETERIDPRFLMWSLNSPQVRRLASKKRRGYTAIHVNVADARKFPVPCPPLSEQHRIVQYLDSVMARVDVLRRLEAETVTEIDALLPAILDWALNEDL